MKNRLENSHQQHIRTHICSIHCIAWSAIALGAIVAISLSFLLNLFGLAIGLTAFPANTTNGQTAFAVGGFVGLIIFAIVAMFPAGWVAGYLGRAHCLKRRRMGEIYGIGTWGLSLIVAILLSSYVGQFLSQTNYLLNRDVVAIKVTGEVNKLSYEPGNTSPTAPASVKVNPQVASEALGVVTLATFFIFFIGFLSCLFGGRIGMNYRRRIETDFNCPECKR